MEEKQAVLSCSTALTERPSSFALLLENCLVDIVAERREQGGGVTLAGCRLRNRCVTGIKCRGYF